MKCKIVVAVIGARREMDFTGMTVITVNYAIRAHFRGSTSWRLCGHD